MQTLDNEFSEQTLKKIQKREMFKKTFGFYYRIQFMLKTSKH